MLLKAKFGKRQEGQSVVEFALVLPIFILLLMGMIEFGRIWMTMNVLSSASREGARIAAVTGPDASRVTNTVQNALSAANLPSGIVSINGPNANSEVTVTVRITYTSITGGVVPGLASPMQLTRSTTMRWEG